MGGTHRAHPDGTVALTRAAGQAGTISWMSTMTHHSPEEVAAAATTPLVYQLYFRGDNAWGEALIRRIEAAGFQALCLTVDSSEYGRRERDIERRYNVRAHQRAVEVPEDHTRQASLTWKDVEWLQKTTKLPLILKGIQHAEDARLAVEHGVPVVYISNHGGRQLDHAPATIELVSEVVDAAAGRAEVVVDSGFQRGTDVLKALALGARAVLIGKAAAWGLAAGGDAGVVRTFDLLGLELRIAMANTGVASLGEVTPALVRRICGCAEA
jgi:glycolate oxidase